ncbi:protein DGCR6-like [Elgaria multicarinata webbii]|uniref:protein DGCR6-like n=1 Tax=Elgaria multicarinata webbii TaxID=159646 RepID=UPI002FCCD7DE
MERFRAGFAYDEGGDADEGEGPAARGGGGRGGGGGDRQQARHYQLLSELQTLVKDLPSASQQRLSYTILSDLALALIDGTVFEIVQGLLEIQHLTERNLYNQRLKLHSEHRVLKQEMLHKHKEDQQGCKAHNLPLLKAAQQRELQAMEQRIHEEQQMMDEKIVLELDQKVVDQQSTLEKAGVSGFYITTNPQELTLQMNLLELIRKLQQKESQPRKPFS